MDSGMAYFKELDDLKISNALYRRWVDYLLTLKKQDILLIAENGLTHQADALNSMIREIIANQPVDKQLIRKLDLLIRTTNAFANKLR